MFGNDFGNTFLDRLQEVSLPEPVAWTPQTAGWYVLGVLVLFGALWAPPNDGDRGDQITLCQQLEGWKSYFAIAPQGKDFHNFPPCPVNGIEISHPLHRVGAFREFLFVASGKQSPLQKTYRRAPWILLLASWESHS